MFDAKFGQQAWDQHEEWGKAAPKPTCRWWTRSTNGRDDVDRLVVADPFQTGLGAALALRTW